MKSTLLATFGVLTLLLGVLLVAFTGWVWFGAWPEEAKQIVDHYRSVAERGAHTGDPLLQDVRARSHRSLGGRWSAVIDPYGRGDLGGIAPRAQEPQSPSDLAEFSFENGLALDVPGDWNSQDPRLVFYQGVVWYKRTFEHEPPEGNRTFLWFGAANYDAQVYLNGELLGRHVGGFTPFNWDVTDRLRAGENLLVVRVDSTLLADDVPTPMTDWLNYGGLTRDVLLVDVPETYVREHRVTVAPDDPEQVLARVTLAGPGRSRGARIVIPELGVDADVPTDEEGRGEVRISAAPGLWTPEAPRLYEVGVEANTGDRVTDAIGFRTIQARGNRILLNGEPIFLRGISLHDEGLDGAGRVNDREQAAALLQHVKDLGANFVRLAHYPHSEHTLRTADAMGLLVWAEIPVYWAVDFANPTTLEKAELQLTEMMARDQNRASIALWGIGNETPEGEERNQFLGALADHVRSIDSTRLVTAALVTDPRELAEFMLGHYVPALFGVETGTWVYPMYDPLYETVDVPALNEYFGWYYSGGLAAVTPLSSHHARRVMIDHIDRIELGHPGTKPLLISETGAGAKQGYRAPEADLAAFSEEYQALVYRKQIELFRNQEGLAGTSPWLLKDFRSPLRMYQGVQDYWNRKGLVSDDGERKLAFDVLRVFYEEVRQKGAP